MCFNQALYIRPDRWGINLVNPSSLAINAQSSMIVKVRVEVPENSQAGDRMPDFRLVMTSQESDVEFQVIQ